ncbi:MAG TPA: GNAT family protein [Actinocrinis sp.]|nr:GNAT family protein [Actinocrinis sp.]
MIDDVHPLADGVVMRPAALADAEGLAAAYVRNRQHLAPWEPVRSEEFFTVHGQASQLNLDLDNRRAGRSARWLLADQSGGIVGSFNLSGIVAGPFRSGNLGYWVDSGLTGRGLATAAVRLVCHLADAELSLHRIQAGTLLNNVGSQRVLIKSGFEPFGVAPRYLHVAGRWQDVRIFQHILNDRAPGEPPAGSPAT